MKKTLISNVFNYKVSEYDMNEGVMTLDKRRVYTAELPCLTKEFQSEVTIWIQAYNHFEKTKKCIESVLKYTSEIDYDLILVDNNAGEETYRYFENLDYPKKTVIHFDRNTGSAYPFTVVPIDMISKYFVLLNNDLIVTKNWLSNLLKVIKSDSKIGVVNPVSNNVSNYQCVSFPFDSYEEMQKKAEMFNISDKCKWEERLRVITLGTLVSKECLYAMGWPFFDVGFTHNFMDDDMSFRARRAGYKLIVARDTWICHDHVLSSDVSEETAKSYDRDINKFRKKYYGVDPWNDLGESIIHIPNLVNKIKIVHNKQVSILGIDVKCGMPILEIKNMLRFSDDIAMSAYSQEAKYYIDLQSICNGSVVCDKEENIKNYYKECSYDYVIIGEPINMYNDPIKVLKEVYALLKKGGQMIFSLKNTRSIVDLLIAAGYSININQCIYQTITLDNLNLILMNNDIQIRDVVVEGYEINSPIVESVKSNFLTSCVSKGADRSEILARLNANRFWIVIDKL